MTFPFSSAANAPIDIASLALVVALATQLTKFLLDYLVSPADKNSNNITRLYVVLLAFVIVNLSRFAAGTPFSLAQVVTSAGDSLAVALGSLASYHLLTGNLAPDPLPPVPLAASPSFSATVVQPLPPKDTAP